MKQFITVEVPCRVCKEHKQLKVTNEGIESYKQGELAQKAFPNLNRDERELLISGVCGTCFDKMFGEE